jgi:hypothetical protein
MLDGMGDLVIERLRERETTGGREAPAKMNRDL